VVALLCILFIKEVPLRTTMEHPVAEPEIEEGALR
jgi:hypothetical protein